MLGGRISISLFLGEWEWNCLDGNLTMGLIVLNPMRLLADSRVSLEKLPDLMVFVMFSGLIRWVLPYPVVVHYFSLLEVVLNACARS